MRGVQSFWVSLKNGRKGWRQGHLCCSKSTFCPVSEPLMLIFILCILRSLLGTEPVIRIIRFSEGYRYHCYWYSTSVLPSRLQTATTKQRRDGLIGGSLETKLGIGDCTGVMISFLHFHAIAFTIVMHDSGARVLRNIANHLCRRAIYMLHFPHFPPKHSFTSLYRNIMGNDISRARYLTLGSFIVNFATQNYGMFIKPNMKDIADAVRYSSSGIAQTFN